MINKILLDLHKEPIDVYEEQKRLKDQLKCNHQRTIESREFDKANVSLQRLIDDQHEFRKNLIEQYRDLVNKWQNDIDELNAKLLAYLQKKEQLNPSHPSYEKIIEMLDEGISSNQRSIEELSENTFELEQMLATLEADASRLFNLPDSHQSFDDIIATAYDEISRRREAASIFSQHVTGKEGYNSNLKKRLSDYAQMVEILEHDAMAASHETLIQTFKNIVMDHAEIAEEYLGIFEKISASFPKMQSNFADILQKYTDGFIETVQTINETRDLNAKMRDSEIVENILNGALGKYMEGDIPFINHLNQIRGLAAFDIEHVAKEVEAGKAKDRGITELINLLQDHGIQITFKDAFHLRLLLVEHYTVVEAATKNYKLDYAKNYLNQHKSLAEKATAIGTTVSAPLRNPSELKNLMQNILEQYSGADGYARDAMLELLDNGISRLPKKSTSK